MPANRNPFHAATPPPPGHDRLAEFLRERGERGATLSELAWEFLRPASGSAGLCERILRPVLEGDQRLREMPGGRWAFVEGEAEDAGGGFVVVESLRLRPDAPRSPEVEVCCVRLGPGGEEQEKMALPVSPSPPPSMAELPPRLRAKMASAPPWGEAAERVASFAEGGAIVSYGPGGLAAASQRTLVGRGRVVPHLALQRLAKAVLGKEAARSREATANALGLPALEVRSAEDAARSTREMLAAFLEQGVVRADQLFEKQHPDRHKVDFGGFGFTREDVANLPEIPGIYLLRDGNGEAVYVGKASNLRRRVGDYFRSRIERDERAERILAEAVAIETQPAGSELEALLMEHRAIRDLSPRINMQTEVHERGPARRAEEQRLIVVLPSLKPTCAEVFMVFGNRAVRQTRWSRRWKGRMAAMVAEFFFGQDLPESADPAEARIFWTWFRRRGDEARAVRPDAAGSAEETARLVGEQAEDLLRGREKAFRV